MTQIKTTYIPLFDRVTIEVAPEEKSSNELEKSAGGIFLPPSESSEGGEDTKYIRRAKILAVGDGAFSPTGEVRKLRVSPGQVVLVQLADVLPLRRAVDPNKSFEGIIVEEHILAIVKDEVVKVARPEDV